MNRESKNILLVLISVAVLSFVLSFVPPNLDHQQRRQVQKVERTLQKREKILDEYVEKARRVPADQWLDFPDFPDDMVLYRYDSDTLQSWVNQFPVSNDDVDSAPFWYRLQYMSNENLYYTPLSLLEEKESFVNLGSAWYVTRVYTDKYTKIITGLLIKNEYPVDNFKIVRHINPNIQLDANFDTVEPDITLGNIVHGIEGVPLFSITTEALVREPTGNILLKWIAICLAIISALFYHYRRGNLQSFSIVIAAITLCFIYSLHLESILGASYKFFSPSLYADSRMYSSLAALIFSNLFIYLVARSIFMLRVKIYEWILKADMSRRRAFGIALSAIAVFMLAYIIFSLRSLIINSSITMELFKVTDLTIYTLVCYISYILLMVALLYIIQLAITTFAGRRLVSLFSWKFIILYILIISLILLSLVSAFSIKKESRNIKVLTDNLAVERDLTLEYRLRSVENDIAEDQIIGLLSFLPNGGNDIIRNRIMERYLYDLGQAYKVSATTCESNSLLIIDQYTPPVDCYDFYQEEIQNYGIQLSPRSSFFFMNNFNGQASYIGVFSYFNYQTYHSARLFLEIGTSHANSPVQELISLPNKEKEASLTNNYSYAKYYNSRLSTNSGNYNYPVRLDAKTVEPGFFMKIDNNRVFFINNISDEETIMVSRERHRLFHYLLFYSYLVIICSLIVLIITRSNRKKSPLWIPQYSFKRKITLLQTVSLVAALICLGIGTIIYILNKNRSNTEAQLNNRIGIVQSTLSEFCQYAGRYSEVNSPQLFEAIDRLASSTSSDINLYDTHGSIITSTSPEIFNQFIMGSRMNDNAFYNIVKKNASKYIGRETVAGKKYLSAYAPLFNTDGTLVAIANIPFVTTVSKMQEDAIISVATIMDLYLMILVASLIFSIMMANSISRPLTEIKQKISEFKLNNSGAKEHIYYKNNKDELGVLVEAYNNMLDDLEESTRQLANQERELAWREMARQIAHEIKNPLTPMKLNLQLLMRMKAENTPGWENKFDETSKSLLQQINILTETAEDFSSFSKFYIEEVSRENLCTLIHEQCVFFDTRDNMSIEFISDLNEAYTNVRKKQINRTFINLISNAIQAIETKQNGIIRITLTEIADYFKIAIEDNGNGVSEKDQKNLFKPYFTTKSSGTGLGLAICHSIIEQSNGKLYYRKSESLGGAAFIMELPKAD